jgi:iron(III) transport system substrate-binding protein
VVRLTDNNSHGRIGAEEQTGKLTADMWVINSQNLMDTRAQQGQLVKATGPDFQANGYRPDYTHTGGYFEVGAAILTFGWNTSLYPQGLHDYPDLLNPKLAGGKIGVIDASVSPAAVDFYMYLEERFGPQFIQALANQKPRIYPSALPVGQALDSGEIVASAFNLPLNTDKASGAPVDFAIAPEAWGTRFFGTLIKGSPHPNAVQVLADFMVSPAGQAAVAKDESSVVPNVPGALTTNDKVRVQDLTKLTPPLVSQYVTKWKSMFHS